MPYREDDVVAPRVAAPWNRNLLVAGGFVLAGAATLAVLLTDDPQVLKVAVVGVAWAFVLATFAAGRRDTDRVAAAAREAELRSAYEAELDREVAARREYELELEHEVRREAEDSMRTELDGLRADIAALSGLREEVARVSALREDIAALSGLRTEVARVAALHDDVAALRSLRQDLGQMADLRADMGRLRAELTEQLSSEMLVERIVMRTQASRLPSDPTRPDDVPGRSLESGSWRDDVPPRELTGGWPAIRLDEPRGTSQFDQIRAEQPATRPPLPEGADARRHTAWQAPVEPLPSGAPLPGWEPPPTTMSEIAPASIARPPGPPPTTMSEIVPASVARPPAPSPVPSSVPPPPPLRQAPAAPLPQGPAGHRPAPGRPPVPPPVAPRDGGRSSSEPPTSHRPAVAPPPVGAADPDGPRAPAREQAPATAPGAAEGNRLAEILAENGVSPSSGGRRRHRYRDEDAPDDVLARVLGRS